MTVSIADYHADPAVSASHLHAIAKSPYHYWSRYLDPNRTPVEPTAAMRLGSLVHCAVLEPDDLLQRYGVAPDRRTKAGKETAEAMHQHLMRTGRKLYGPLSKQLTGAASGWRVMGRGMAELSPDTKREAAKLAAEIRHFLHGYRQMRGLDPEHIYSIHLGDDMAAHLRVSRLARIADLLESAQ